MNSIKSKFEVRHKIVHLLQVEKFTVLNSNNYKNINRLKLNVKMKYLLQQS